MGRSTFEGPVLSGDIRFGPFRNVGYDTLTQNGYLNLTNTSSNTAGYAGASGVFVNSNNIPNGQATVYVPSSTLPLGQNVVQAIPADTTSQIYRGWVCYLPTGSDVDIPIIDVATVPTVASGTISTIKMYVSNNYTVEAGTPTYGSVSSISATGRQTFAYTAAGVNNANNTSTDIIGINNNQSVSQVVFTLSIAGSSMTTLNAGQIYVAIRYVQQDGNIGTTTAYPYGNFD
jgi:hypothetical protein